MTTAYRKKMIEVALPLEAINKAAAREKSIRHGHPSTLHLWWARRPLAACRAVLFASLVDDPDSDPEYRKPDGTVDEDKAAAKRAELFNLIEELVQWENSNNPKVINKARAEIARCVASRKIELGEFDKATIIFGKDKGKKHKAGPLSNQGVTAYEVLLMRARPEVVNAFLAEYAPPVLDPFCGGGSIPLEAQRLGLRAYGSDLNPVPVLITKALIEIPPKFAGKPPVNPKSDNRMVWNGAEGLAEDIRYYGKWMRDEAEKRIGQLYPKVTITKDIAKDRPDLEPHVGKELTIIAWLWARTVASPDPASREAYVPLIRSYWLATRKGREAWLKPVVDRRQGRCYFEVRTGQPPKEVNPSSGTVSRKGGTCLLSGSLMPFSYLREEAAAGRMQSCLLAVVADGGRGRIYLPASAVDSSWLNPPVRGTVPEADLPEKALGFGVQSYGFRSYRDLYTPRQLAALATFFDLAVQAGAKVLQRTRGLTEFIADGQRLFRDGDGALAYADAVTTYLVLAVSKLIDSATMLCTWHSGSEYEIIRAMFTRQALQMTWDFAEGNVLSQSTGNFYRQVEILCAALQGIPRLPVARGHAAQLEATAENRPRECLVSTDPPYYDNIGYADLADVFYAWLRLYLRDIWPDLCSTLLTPKDKELIAAAYRHDDDRNKAKEFFEAGLRRSFGVFKSLLPSDTPMSVFYAFRQTEEDKLDDVSSPDRTKTVASTGWETMLEGLVSSGLVISGTWPVRSELGNRLRSRLSNALASSVVLVCRPRHADAPLATRRDFISALRRELPEALRNLQRGSVAPVDLAQAAIGPGMAVFTRYSKVMETDGSAMSVRTALGLINQALDEVLAEQEGEFDADTRWALAWFEQFGMDEGAFGMAETLSKAKNTAVNGLVEAGVIKARAGKVRLLKRDELPGDWNPATDKRLTIWEITQHLIRTLDQKGESAAAVLLRTLGGTADIARDLAYRLYTMCERKKWADEALAYNGLVIAWPELTKLAMASPAGRTERQSELFT